MWLWNFAILLMATILILQLLLEQCSISRLMNNHTYSKPHHFRTLQTCSTDTACLGFPNSILFATFVHKISEQKPQSIIVVEGSLLPMSNLYFRHLSTTGEHLDSLQVILSTSTRLQSYTDPTNQCTISYTSWAYGREKWT